MNNYCIITDSGSDLTKELAKEIDVTVLDLTVLVDGCEPQRDSAVDIKKFYDELRNQKGATTSALNIDDFITAFDEALGEGKDVLYLGFSSGLSSTYSAGKVAAEEMAAKREMLTDNRHKAVTAFECRYFYGTMKYLDMFMSSREALFESLILEKNGISYKDIERWASSDGQLQGKMTKLYESLTKDKLVCDIFEDGAKKLPAEYAEIVKGIKAEETPFAVAVSFPVTMTRKSEAAMQRAAVPAVVKHDLKAKKTALVMRMNRQVR